MGKGNKRIGERRMTDKIKKAFENIWKVRSMNKGYKEKDKDRYYELFLDGFGCALIDVEKEDE